MAHEIVMSIPSLYKSGGLLLAFPGRQAAKVLDKPCRQYIASVLMKLAAEVPVIINSAIAIQQADDMS